MNMSTVSRSSGIQGYRRASLDRPKEWSCAGLDHLLKWAE